MTDEESELRKALEFQQALNRDRYFQLKRSVAVIRGLIDGTCSKDKAEQFLREVKV